ncbi:MAG: hypothetical protein KC684_10410 [Candidatus Omnitrophica bacterium]|nr:hypothetical protein [Candidatus Omnitrophota bacterium]
MKKFLVFAILLTISKTASACSICFYGDSDDPMNKGLRAGILLLLAVLSVLMVLFIKFFLGLKKRASQN